MKVNIAVITADLSWIAGRLARELASRLPAYGIIATLNGPPADLEYQQIVYGPPTRRPAVGLFTHGTTRPRQFCREYDGHIALNPSMADLLRQLGAPHPVVIEQAVDERFIRRTPILFGVAGRAYGDGRKGEGLVKQMVAAGYEVVGWGDGWPCPILGRRLEDLYDLYRHIDYYVVTSLDEGGCTPIIEAMAMGKPVISPRIGFAIRRPVLEYEAGNWESLSRVLRFLTVPSTYDDWARQHAEYFQQWA